MSKIQVRWLILGFIFLILFNALFFLLDGNQPIASIWISYGFIHLAYLQMLIIPFVVPKSKSTHVFIESTALVSAVYFIIELFIGLVLILFKPESWILTLTIQLVLLAACIAALLLNHFANEKTASVEEQRKKVQKSFRNSIAVLGQAMTILEGKEKEYINTLLSDLKASPLVANSTLQGIENNIHAECVAIQEAASVGNTDGIHMHGAVLSQLILLRKQTPVD